MTGSHRVWLAGWLWVVCLLGSFPAKVTGQHEQHQAETVEHTASGTSLEPRSTPQAMLHWTRDPWRLMLHGTSFLAATQQSGTQGRDKIFAPNWTMLSLDRPLRRGHLTLRTMLSLEPATVTGRQYPLLFQTGETAFGRPLINAQHPHDFFMELGALYSLPLAEKTELALYAAVVGDPALGPVAFPHRSSAAEMPEAPLSHHLQDSTHIVSPVVTIGFAHRWWRLEASAFHGREPDEYRWDLDPGRPDSWSVRLTLRPGRNWAVQVSHGYLNEPEELEAGDITRTTASVSYNRPLLLGNWATTLIWGRNHKRPSRGNRNSYLLETSLQFRKRNYVFARIENLDREGLFLTGDPESEPMERVAAFTIGAARDLWSPDGFRLALGFNLSLHRIPGLLQPLYGSRPVGARVFLRLRLGRAGEHATHSGLH